ncbi:DUF3140 domain-containing protein [Streptomyces sp. NPDC015127]|uniref:DUF3140 domain-containing protein n=1 Tax=Streptomyces sp. NPDC015127 TaxID=3364939 RepID=UPI00370013A8
MAVSAHVSAELWDEFHKVVNMTSRELREWLNVDAAGEETEELPDKSGRPTGQRVLDVLGKRRTDLTEDDVQVMQRVCDIVRSQRAAELDPKAGGDDWRRSLMSIGHDPLKPS